MSVVRALVCGTNYGTRYLQAIQRASRQYELGGIVSRGSARSTLLAARYGVPLFRSAGEVPSGIDVAFAAMGPEGNEVVLELLRRGIHVLCEHPVESQFLAQALETANASGVSFNVNAHFASLKAPRAFIRRCTEIIQSERPIFIDAAMTPRLLYGFLDIVHHVVQPLWPIDFTFAPQSLGWFETATGRLGGIDTSLHLEHLKPEASEENVVDCRIEIGFLSGVVRLLSLAGPVVWNLNHRRQAGAMSGIVFSQDAITVEQFEEERLEAVERSMESLLRQTGDGRVPPEQTAEHLLGVSRAYEATAEFLP